MFPPDDDLDVFDDDVVSPYLHDVGPYVQEQSPYLQEQSPYLQEQSPYLQEQSPYLQDQSPYLQPLRPYTERFYLAQDDDPEPVSPFEQPLNAPRKDFFGQGPMGSNQLESKVRDSEGVKHVSDAAVRNQKYRVALGNKMTRRSGMIFDTAAVKSHFRRPDRDRSKPQIGMSWLVNPYTATAEEKEMYRPLQNDWLTRSLLWVWADLPGGRGFFSHVGKANRFHHSSFSSNGAIKGAGEWIVDAGKLTHISANSGHYQPTLDYLHASVLAMNEAIHDDTMVLLWDTHERKWTYVNAQEFMRDPGTGRYKAHERNE